MCVEKKTHNCCYWWWCLFEMPALELKLVTSTIKHATRTASVHIILIPAQKWWYCDGRVLPSHIANRPRKSLIDKLQQHAKHERERKKNKRKMWNNVIWHYRIGLLFFTIHLLFLFFPVWEAILLRLRYTRIHDAARAHQKRIYKDEKKVSRN